MWWVYVRYAEYPLCSLLSYNILRQMVIQLQRQVPPHCQSHDLLHSVEIYRTANTLATQQRVHTCLGDLILHCPLITSFPARDAIPRAHGSSPVECSLPVPGATRLFGRTHRESPSKY